MQGKKAWPWVEGYSYKEWLWVYMWNWTVTCCQLITRKSPFQPQVSGVGGVPGVHAACRVVEAFAPEWGSVQGKESAFQEKASNINSATARIAALKPKPLSKLQTLVLITPLLIYDFLAALFWLLLIMYMNCRLVFRSFSKSFFMKDAQWISLQNHWHVVA